MENSGGRLTIGVDFGTTYSGVAYSNLQDESNEPLLIRDWGTGPTSDKVPSVIRYNVSDHVGGVLGYKWGFEVKHHERRQEWFKLALDPMTYKADDCIDFSTTYVNQLAEPPPYSKDTTTLVTDYLTALRKNVEKTLMRKLGKEALTRTRITWVITTPAVWSKKAQYQTLECAKKAGIGGGERIIMTSEPEAVAAYALKVIRPLSLRPGQNVVICDAGGGTVDLITYRIKSLSPNLEVEESAIPSGGKCGGVFVNRIFEKMVEDRLGKDSGLTDIGKHNLLNQFETYAKRHFPSVADRDDNFDEFYLPAAGARDNSSAKVSGGSMLITADDMKKVFDPVVNEVINLVKHQIESVKSGGDDKKKSAGDDEKVGEGDDRKVSAVLLVGGFGESRYLQKRLEQAISPIELLCPENGWSAIARGAVIKGIAARSPAPTWVVSSRKAKEHYGIEIREAFKPHHDPTRKFWDELEGKWMCQEVMMWFVNRGNDLYEDEEQVFRLYRNVAVGESLKRTEDLVASYDDSRKGPQYYDASTCRRHVSLKVDLSKVPKNEFEKKMGANGKEYYHIRFDILATFRSAEVEYKWRLCSSGKIHGSVKARYTS
jgi:molecular chaperone DnaK (HSP70)